MTHTVPFTVQADLDLGRRVAPYLVTQAADVNIHCGEVPEQLEGEGPGGVSYQIRGSRMLLKVPNGARYLIEDGNRIVYRRNGNQPDKDVALFLLGSAWGALCYQRGLIALHASAVIVGDAVHAFAGPSGVGKSTLAAGLAARGRALFTDDLVILDPARLEPEPLCFTGHKDLKLWEDSLQMTGATRGPTVRSAQGFSKFYAMPHHESSAIAGRLASLFVLSEETGKDGPSIEPITGSKAVTQLVTSVYRPAIASAILGRQALYQGLAKLAGRVKVRKFKRRLVNAEFDAVTDHINAWIGTHG